MKKPPQLRSSRNGSIYIWESTSHKCFPQRVQFEQWECAWVILSFSMEAIWKGRKGAAGRENMGFQVWEQPTALFLAWMNDRVVFRAFITCQRRSLRLFIHLQQTPFQTQSKTCCKAVFSGCSAHWGSFLKPWTPVNSAVTHLSAILAHVSLTSHHRSDVVI